MKTNEKAAKAYEMYKADIFALLDMLRQETEKHAEYAKTAGIEWGFVGDVAHVRKALIETQAFFAQQDQAFIEKRLAEMK